MYFKYKWRKIARQTGKQKTQAGQFAAACVLQSQEKDAKKLTYFIPVPPLATEFTEFFEFRYKTLVIPFFLCGVRFLDMLVN